MLLKSSAEVGGEIKFHLLSCHFPLVIVLLVLCTRWLTLELLLMAVSLEIVIPDMHR